MVFWLDEIRTDTHHDKQLSGGVGTHDEDARLWEVVKKPADGDDSIGDEKQDSTDENLPKRGSITFFEAISGGGDHPNDHHDVGDDRDFHTAESRIDKVEDKGGEQIDRKVVKEGFYKIQLFNSCWAFLCHSEADDVADMRHQKGSQSVDKKMGPHQQDVAYP